MRVGKNRYHPLMTVGVYGLGRFGRFWTELLAKKFDVVCTNRSPDKSTPAGARRCAPAEFSRCDAVFLCTAISSIDAVTRELAPLLSPGTTVIDTCSVKVYPVRLMEENLPSSIRLIASHPMFGPDSGRDGVETLPMIMWPVRCPSEVFSYWKTVFSSYGLDVVEMSPADHDEEAAYTQGITHLVGRVLKELGLKQSRIGTLGYRKILDVIEQTCNDPMQLFVDLQVHNPYTDRMRADFRSALGDVVRAIEDGKESNDGLRAD